MKKTRQFDDIKNGELIRFLVEPSSSPYEKEVKAHWDFGIVVCNYMKNFFDCQPALNYGFAQPDPNHPWEQSVNAPGPQAVRRELKNIIAVLM